MNKTDNARQKAFFEMLKTYNNRLSKNQSESEDKLMAWASELSKTNLTVQRVVSILRVLAKENKTFMPSLNLIISQSEEPLSSPSERAYIAVDEIILAIQYFGYMRLDEAFNSLSVDARIGLNSPSAMKAICDTTIDQLPTVKAQLRKTIEANLNRKINSSKHEQFESIGFIKKLE